MTTREPDSERLSNQVIGNIGLYYACYELSKLGWNALPTSRNAKGVDVIIYDTSATRTHTLQIKSLTSANPVPFGNNLDNLFAEYLVIVRKVLTSAPEIFVAKVTGELRSGIHIGVKNEKKSYWLQPKQYEQFSKNLEKVIGRG